MLNLKIHSINGLGTVMKAMKKLLRVTGHLVVIVSVLCGFALGAIFGETVINRTAEPTVLTYYLAGIAS